ncbi:MAG: recombinase family protein [Glycomyces artemisiae]|uniref:Recombinase family protein n=1 Tax=Glycomyces artemisiae TaxID=1076443 RepID=A0A850C7Q9_9ACTN|nr:recombinase family protein [Glycomyces artemisiae]
MVEMPELRTEREFLRVSIDTSGEEVSIEEQRAANIRDAASRRTELHPDPYRDTGSISHHARKPRAGDWERMIADIRADRFGADGLRLWESSRAYRTMADTVLLLDLLRERRIWLTITTHDRVYNPCNWRDRKSLLEDAIDNESESAKTSDRTLRSVAARAEKGRPHGRLPFGYRAVYDSDTGKLIRREPRDDEADLLREAYRRIAQGHTLYMIVNDWEKRGAFTRSGVPWKTTNLGKALVRTTYAGIRQHDPGWMEVNGQRNPTARARRTEATWEPIVDRDLWLRVRAILNRPERRHNAGSRIAHEFTGVIGCVPCTSGLRVNKSHGNLVYRCHDCRGVQIRKEDTDEVVTAVLFGYMSQPAVYNRTFHSRDSAAALSAAQLALAEAERELEELRTLGETRQLTAVTVARMEPPLVAEVQRLGAVVDGLDTPDEIWSMLPPGRDIEARWGEAAVSTRHTVAKRVLTPRYAGRPMVGLSTKKGFTSQPAIDRIVWHQEPAPETA